MSPLEDVTGKALSRWMETRGPEADTVISSRVRLARNVEGMPFPHLMSDEQADEMIRMVAAAFRSAQAGKLGLGGGQVYRMSEMSDLDRYVLVEKHLISPNLAQEERKGAVYITPDEAVSVMINEEDHLRIQCLYPGLQLGEALALANKVDDLLESQLQYAWSEKYGYLTACPTNVGTGLRVSVMAHLPALVINNQAGRVFSTVVKLGFLVRGLYGEGTEAIGNIFQVSNQVTLGHSEAETVQNLESVIEQVIGQEKQVRQAMYAEMKEQIEDKVGRAYGILLWSHVLSSQEAMQLLSDVRLGVELGVLKGLPPGVLNELLVAIRPAFLQKTAGRVLDAGERDVRRAEIVRAKLGGSGRGTGQGGR